MFTLVPAVLLSFLLLAVDAYVYRNWRPFARARPRLRWTLRLYPVLAVLMPLVIPLYVLSSNWWEVEPKGLRFAVVAAWLVWYVPKALLAVGLAVKDGARFASWLFGWFREQLQPASAATEERTGLDLSDMQRMSRAEFLRTMGWTAAGVPFVLVGYSVFRHLYDFQVHRVEVPIPGLPRQLDGLRIAQLSDLHAGSLFSARPMEDAVDLVNAERPDLVAVTGDYVNHDHREAALVLPALDRLRAGLGAFGCLGNHDHYADVGRVARLVDATAVDLLVNDGQTLEIDGARLHVVGTDNTGFGQRYANLPRALRGLRRSGEDATLLLAHDPTFWDTHVRPRHPEIDLTLSGHTHGGQVGFEVGPARWSLARVMYERWAGLYAEPRGGADGPEGRQHLYVNRGLGTVGPPLRLGIRPEVTILTLKRV
ncbi:MAG: metallophosphoesterase [Rhodothermales bacterium]|nr:metallophosphoesterase [Rhodothermales bacterium]